MNRTVNHTRLLEHVSVPVMLVEPTGQVTFANAACNEVLGEVPQAFGEIFLEPPLDRVIEDSARPGGDLSFFRTRSGREFDAWITPVESGACLMIELRPTSGQGRQDSALRRAQRRLQLAQDASRTAFFEFVPSTDHFVTSTLGAEIVGASQTVFTAGEVLSYVPAGDAHHLSDAFSSALKTREGFELEIPIRHGKTGEDRWLLVKGQLLAGVDAGPEANEEAMFGTFQDITARKLAETEIKASRAALEQSEEKFRTFMQSVPAVVYIKDQDHRFRFANDAMLRLGEALAIDYRDLAGKRTVDVYDEALAAQIDAEDDDIIKTGQARMMMVPLPRAGGGRVVLEGLKFPIVLEGETLLGGFFVDVTARVEMDAEKERMMSAIEHSGEMIVITDPGGEIVYVNPVFERTMGYSREEVIGGHNAMWRSGLHDQSFYDRAWAQLQRGETWQGALINRRKDGSLIHEEATISQVRDAEGRVTGYVEVKRDVTRQKELEQRLAQSQKMESVGTLAGGVAHDYNNVLQTILGNTELMLDVLDPASELAELAGEVKRAALHSATLTSQLLAFARKQVIQPRPVNLNDSFGGMKNMLGRLIGSNIDLTFDPGDALWNVHVDPSQVQQVITNICVNARDAIDSVGTVAVRTRNIPTAECVNTPVAEPHHQDFVLLEFTDSGRGMSEGALRRAFEPFFTTKPLNQGTGLGLATVYGIVRQNQGYVFIDSEEGRGTTVSIFWPRHHETTVNSKV